MAIDSAPAGRPPVPGAIGDQTPVIDNQIGSYRAVSRLAIFSLLFGLASSLTFVWGWFAILGALAVAAGAAALAKIRRAPDALTGAATANVGIAAGLLLSLVALTVSAVQDFMILTSAGRYARAYERVLNNGTLEDNLFAQVNPAMRAGKTPRAVTDEMLKASPNRGAFDQQIQGLNGLKRRVGLPGQAITYQKILSHAVVNLDIYAMAVYEIKGPVSKEFPEEAEKALVQIKGRTDIPGYDWYVGDVTFPAKEKPAGSP